MSLPIYQRVAVTDSGDVIPGAEYTVINENTGVAAPIYSDRTGATLLTAPYFADSAGTIQFFIAQGTTFRVAASGGVGTYTDRYVYGVSEAVFVSDNGNVEILSGNVGIGTSSPRTTLDLGMPTLSSTLSRTLTDYQMMLEAPSGGGSTYAHNIGWSEITGSDVVVAAINAIDLGAASATGITFATGTSASIAERLRIDSAGNLLVAKTSTSSSTAGIRFAGSDPGYSEHTRSGGTVMYLNRLSNDGTIMQFAQGNSAVGSIGVSGGNNISIGSTSASHAGISFATAVILPMTAGVVSNGSINLGDANSRFDSIYLASSPVVTSDRNQKQDILEITAAETAVATVCKGLMRSFRLKDAVAKRATMLGFTLVLWRKTCKTLSQQKV